METRTSPRKAGGTGGIHSAEQTSAEPNVILIEPVASREALTTPEPESTGNTEPLSEATKVEHRRIAPPSGPIVLPDEGEIRALRPTHNGGTDITPTSSAPNRENAEPSL